MMTARSCARWPALFIGQSKTSPGFFSDHPLEGTGTFHILMMEIGKTRYGEPDPFQVESGLDAGTDPFGSHDISVGFQGF